jgi:methylmalonyl-CoA/ethylmalonyl-CoA epimerase
MANQTKRDTPGLAPTQIAWVVKDLERSKAFFQEMFGVKNFMPTGTTRLQDYDGTYYGERKDAENLFTLTYSGGTFLEIIQPLSGKSIFTDFINDNPAGGIHHIAYSTPMSNLDNVISDFEAKGHAVISSYDTPIAYIVFFDTRAEIGVFTEIMGITKEGEKAVEEMRIGLSQVQSSHTTDVPPIPGHE